jgi:GMP synthase (glutamine-hydrolysing)
LKHDDGSNPVPSAAELISSIRAQAGDSRVLLGISGGVDSTTLGVLLHRALGAQLSAVFVDHGLLRQGEAAEVEGFLRELGVNLTVAVEGERFLNALSGVVDPEQKRKIIGREFISVFKDQAQQLQLEGGPFRFLAQGTLYPDVAESVDADGNLTVKSHHNVGGLPAELGFELLEPFRTLYKDGVREIAAELGLPRHLIDRHPFPGPGLAVRCLGEVTEERLEVLRAADAIFTSSLREAGLYGSTWQALAVLAPLQSVGVTDGQRTYGQMIALRAVDTADGMTADWTRFPHDFLADVSSRILQQVPGVNRVVYDITMKPPGTVEWE